MCVCVWSASPRLSHVRSKVFPSAKIFTCFILYLDALCWYFRIVTRCVLTRSIFASLHRLHSTSAFSGFFKLGQVAIRPVICILFVAINPAFSIHLIFAVKPVASDFSVAGAAKPAFFGFSFFCRQAGAAHSLCSCCHQSGVGVVHPTYC